LTNVAIEKWDENGLGDEPNNLAAINSLIGYRSYRYGKHLDLIITDQHSYRGADPFSDPAAGAFGPEFPDMVPEDVAKVHLFLAGEDADYVSGVVLPVSGALLGGM